VAILGRRAAPAAQIDRAARAAWISVLLAAVLAGAACTGPNPPSPAPPASGPSSASPGSPGPTPAPEPTGTAHPAAGTLGVQGSYLVGHRQMRFTEPPHAGPSGARLGPRRLVTLIRYPLARPATAGRPARGTFPLLVFAPGFMQCAGPYAPLLRAWASAGYVVAAVDFPRTDCRTGASAHEPDVVNQPADMSYVITRLLALSGRPRGLLAGLLDPREVAVAGHSDGGDTVAALAANACCADRRLAAAAVMSGAEWPDMTALYFTHRAPPMLLVQPSDDVFNPPSLSARLYRADPSRARFYLGLPGATHTLPAMGSNPVERLTARVTLAFFNRFVLRQAGAAAAMARAGNVPGRARLVSGGHPPP
jgi:dienelactone hydrolase